MGFKALYQRFRKWQISPLHYEELGSETYCCCNCGQEYAGAYCPRCGQKARAGRITWSIVRRGLMDVFGLGGRSLPYSLWQLLWRPGYLISDYINGKWQVTFPPVKMLVLVAIFIFFIGKLIFPEFWFEFLEEPDKVTSTGMQYYVDSALNWLTSHFEWLLLLLFSLVILPTWYVFRHSLRNTRHNVPQGFFIQVFITVQCLLWLFIISLFFKAVGQNVDTALLFTVLLMPFLWLVDYKQVFGYSWWGTLWRGSCIAFIFTLCVIIAVTSSAVMTKPERLSNPKLLFRISMFVLSLLSLIGLVLSTVNVINRKLWRERGLWRSMRWPLLFLVVLVGAMGFLEWQKPGSLFKILYFLL